MEHAIKFDLNEAPPSPNQPPGSDWRVICESCRKLGDGEMMVCCLCGGGHHLTCLRVKERQVEWKCFKCLLKVADEKNKKMPSLSSSAAASGGSGSGLGVFGISAVPPPPQQQQQQEIGEKGEGFVTGIGTMQDIHGDGFVERTLNVPEIFGNMRYVGNGSEFQKASCSVTPFTSSAFEVPLQKRLNFDREKLMGCSLNGLPQSRDSAPVNSEKNLDEFPVQFEDFFVMSIGKIDSRPSFHSTYEIWPIGYRSIWHDRATGSVFVCQVLDRGSSRPVFRVRRLPCAKQSIPNASTVIWRPKDGLHDGTDKIQSNDSAFSGLVGDDDLSIQMLLTECSPPRLDSNILSCIGMSTDPNHGFQKVSCLATDSALLPRSSGVIADNFGSGDIMSEFFVDGSSSSSAWEMVSETLISACRKVYDETGSFRFGCKHSVDGGDIYSPESFGSLTKFCYSANPMINVPGSILSTKELEASCEVLSKWIRLDRFGLDMGFVQELIEQLPGVTSCSNYQSLSKRIHSSALLTVGNGLLLARRKNDLKIEKESCSLIQSCRRPNPSGKQFSSKLPQKLIGDVLQACDFSWRFSEVLELGAPFSLLEIEDELINPWLDAEKPLNKTAIVIEHIGNGSSCNGSAANDLTSGPSSASYTNFHGRDSHDVITTEVDYIPDPSSSDPASYAHRSCTGALLKNAHTSLLKVVITELLSKVAPHVKPNIESGERRGKKDVDSTVTAEKIKLDVLPMNELTWPELARRYILAAVSMYGIDSAEITREGGKLPEDITRECEKMFHCLQGDGGVLCGSLTGVAAMEADAVLLAEASNKIFESIRSKFDVLSIVRKEPDLSSSKAINMGDSNLPEWAQELEPVRKLPTNVGARIKTCIYKALDKNPPEWAEAILRQSITKEVYRGNASGPTKRMVLSVLTRVSPEDPKVKPEKKEKSRKVKTLSEIIMKQCRIMLRHAIAADEKRVFCNLLGRTADNDDKGLLGYPAMVSRPLDFRTIDIRLTAGAYGGSHEAFIEDVREVWQNIRTAYGERPEFTDLVERLSRKFEKLYEEEVLSLVNKVSVKADHDHQSEDTKDDIDGAITFTSERTLPKAPWENGVCKACGIDKDDESVLLCDQCDSEYHTYCLDPPLPRIPDGNWYCPLCDGSQCILQDGSCGTRLLRRQGRKRRLQREFTQKISGTLAHLADMMELKEYWELTVEERVFLLKYLCDEALSSSIIHDHLDHCASVCADMESEPRSSTSELKHLKSREDILVGNSGKTRQSTCSEELGSAALASMMSDDGILLRRTDESSKNGLEDCPDEKGPKKQLSLSKCASEKPFSSSCSQMQFVVTGESGLSNSNLQESNHSNSPTQAIPEMSFVLENASQANQLELSFVEKEISSFQDSIKSHESETHKKAIRKEFLGRDAAGRLYWAFGNPGTCQKVIAGGSWMILEGKETEPVDPIEENLVSYSCFPSNVQNHLDANEHSSWTCYESDAEIRELLGWLKDDDAREMELKESIVQLQRNNLRYSKNAPNHLQNKVKLSSCDHFPSTQAKTVLEKMFGSCLQLGPSELLKSQGSGDKINSESRLYRCKCLELIRPSRHHCVLCHRTFSTAEDFEGHRNGNCKLVSFVPKSCQENEGSSKGKRKILEGPPRQKSFDSRKKSKEESKREIQLPTDNKKLPYCPYNFEEIYSKFVTKDSLKEKVSDIGLIGAGGAPTFVPKMPSFQIDPAFLLASPTVNKTVSGGVSTLAENLQQQSQKVENNYKCVDNGMNEPSKDERLKSKGTTGNSRRYKRSRLSVDKSRIISQSSLRPLVGKVTEILKQLKMNLLDMGAALPDEALRPTRTTSEKRFLWREFVKAAESIYEMIQATIVLEDMIKTEYLRNEWWYWSSPAAAAKVSTVSALALRIYALDAAIIYDRPLSSVNKAETSASRSKKTEKKESSNKSKQKNKPRARSPPLAVTFNLGSSLLKKGKKSKKGTDSGGEV